MKSLFMCVSAIGLAVLGGCFSAENDEAVASNEGAALSASKLDDSAATLLLAGGCSVADMGRTSGSGGACPTTVSGILDLLPQDKTQVFVVSEKGDLPKDSDTTYRFVIASDNGGLPVFVAAVGDKKLDEEGAEVIGFSPSLQAFVFYKVEGNRWVRKGDGTQIKSTTDGTDQPFECARCHSTGAPLMKELHDSWGNWDSTWFSMEKPQGANALFSRLFDKKVIADQLEKKIIDAMHLHSKGRVARAVKDGELKGVLTQLMCEVGEPSLIGAHSKSGDRIGGVKSGSTMLPTAIVMNQFFVPPRTGGTGTELGLEQSLALKVPSLGDLGSGLDARAYMKAIDDNGQTIGGKKGDTMFPMTSPEKSYADIDAVQELLRQKLIDQDIVADVLMTDFTVSSFSKVRCDLAQTLPKSWKSPDELRRTWSKALGNSQLRGAKGLRARLSKKSDTNDAEKKLEAFAKACKSRPAADLTTDLVKIVSQRRVEFAARYQNIIESTWLVPQDELGSAPNAIRLSGTTCEIEDTSEPFVGEE